MSDAAGRWVVPSSRRRWALFVGVMVFSAAVPTSIHGRAVRSRARRLRGGRTVRPTTREPSPARWTVVVDQLVRRAVSVPKRMAAAFRSENVPRARIDRAPAAPWCAAGVGGPDPTLERTRLARVASDGIAAAIGLASLVPHGLDLDRRRIPSSWPVDGVVTSGFGRRRSPWGGGMEHHPGIDIEAARGTRVSATAEGEVSFAGRRPGYGLMVIVDHGGATETVYAHLSTLRVQRGQHVRDRDWVGTVGATGRATGPHLHYEVRVADRAVDPLPYLADPELRIARPGLETPRPPDAEDVHS